LKECLHFDDVTVALAAAGVPDTSKPVVAEETAAG